MFLDDIALVTEAVNKYGLRKPVVDLGGQEYPIVADYTTQRIGRVEKRPFEQLDPNYEILNPEKGDPPIERLRQLNHYGTAICLSVLEHVENPFEVFKGIYRVLQPEGIAIVSTLFIYKYHPAPIDYWRFTPEALAYLGKSVGFKILECDWRLDVERGIALTGEYQRVKSVYGIYQK